MAKNPELIIKIGANDAEFKKTMQSLPAEAERSLAGLKVGIAGAAVAFTALAAGVASSVQEFKQFEKGFSNVVTLLDESSFKTKGFIDGIDSLKQGIFDLRATSGKSFDDLNKGLFDLISAGIDAEKSIEVLAVATKLALAGATDTSTAVDGLSSAIKAFGMEVGDAQRVAEKFFTAQKFGKTTIAELSNDFGKVAATAAGLGVSFEELLASVSASTLAAIGTNEAYTGLKAVLSNIIKPSKEAANEAARLGIEFNSTALRANGLAAFLDEVTSAANFDSQSLERLFGSTEALNVVMALTGNQADDFKNILKELGDETKSAGVFADAYQKKTETLDQKLAELEGSFSSLKAEIGEAFSEESRFAIQQMINLVNLLRYVVRDGARDFASFAQDVALSQLDVIASLTGTTQEYKRLLGQIEDEISSQDFEKKLDAMAEKMGLSSKKDFGDGSPTTNDGGFFESFLRGQKAATDLIKQEADKRQKLLDDERKRNEEAQDEQNKKDNIKAENEAKRQREKDLADAIAREEKLKREDEQFEEDLERLNERLAGIDEVENEFQGLREIRYAKDLQAKARTDKQKEAADKALSAATIRASDLSTAAILDNLQEVFGTETAVGKAIFLIRKGQAIANTIVSTQQAMALARATVPPPGGDILAAKYALQGAVNVGVIAATSIAELSGAKEGGIVKGGSFGRDTQPFLLAKDEVILPSKLNPLSPNFDRLSENGMFGGQRVAVEIGFQEDASRILTVKQREDTALGIQR